MLSLISGGPSFDRFSGFNGPSAMFSLGPILFVVVIGIIALVLIFTLVRYLRNSTSPKESVYAKIVAKRSEVRSSGGHHHQHHNNHFHTGSTHTYYYITLEFANGSRREYLDVKNLFGIVVEGDSGYALTQGEWLVAFERDMKANAFQN